MTFMLSSVEEILQTLGGRIRTQRLAQGISQQVLADRAGLFLGIVDELEDLFVLRQQSIAQMERANDLSRRQRAPRQGS